ncbi:MAG TPA: twin-arginine translocase TatA/TatE family subunit [Longimicrobiales bacterium]|nr:twin-arginine translocase TatA/TatE family subunit [Longimicrobiales bacterium]
MWEVLLILLVLLLVFGAKRLPELGGSLGKGIREFKKSVKEIETELNRSVLEEPRDTKRVAAPQPQAAASAPAESVPVKSDDASSATSSQAS